MTHNELQWYQSNHFAAALGINKAAVEHEEGYDMLYEAYVTRLHELGG